MYSKPLSLGIMKIMVVLHLLHKLLPIVGEYMPMPVYLMVFMLATLTVMYTVLTSRYAGLAITTLLVFLPSVFQLIYIVSAQGMTEGARYLYGEAQTYLYAIISILYMNLFDIKASRRLLGIILVAYIITGITSAIACTVMPNIVRIITADSGEEIYYQYRRMNVGEFSFAYEFILLTPLLICGIKSKRINGLLGVLLLIFVAFVVLQMQFTLGLILYAVILSTLLLPKLSSRYVMMLLLSGIVLVLISRTLIADGFDFLSTVVDNSSFSTRFEYIATVLRGEEVSSKLENNAGTRYDLYLMSLEAFLENPLFGHWGNGSLGGHSYILDNAARFGIPGVLSICIMYYTVYKFFLKPFKHNICYAYMLIGYFLSIVMAIINTKPFLIIFTCVYPLFAHVFSYDQITRKPLIAYKR